MKDLYWEQLVVKHGASVYRTAYRLSGNHTDSHECFQETFLETFEYSRTQNVKNMPGLLIRIATSHAIERLRRRYARRTQTIDNLNVTVVQDDKRGTHDRAASYELANDLRKAVGRLPKIEAEALCLHCLSDFPYRRIAAELATNANTVSVAVNRAKQHLFNLLRVQNRTDANTKNKTTQQNEILEEYIQALKNEPAPSTPPKETIQSALTQLRERKEHTAPVEHHTTISLRERWKAIPKSVRIPAIAVILLVLVNTIIILSLDPEKQPTPPDSDIPPVAPTQKTIEPPQNTSSLPDPEEEQIKRLEHLMELSDAGDIQEIINLLEHGDDQMRLTAAYFLVEIGDESTLEMLAEMLAGKGELESDDPLFIAITALANRLIAEESAKSIQAIQSNPPAPEEIHEESILDGNIQGQLLLNGTPLNEPNVIIRAFDPNGNLTTVTTNTYGEFAIDAKPFTTYKIRINHFTNNALPVVAETEITLDNSESIFLELQLEDAVAVTFLPVNESNQQKTTLHNLYLTQNENPDIPINPSRTNHNQSFLAALAPGQYTAHIRPLKLTEETITQPIRINKTNNEQTIEILIPNPQLVGRLIDASGNPVDGLINIMNTEKTATGPNGIFRVTLPLQSLPSKQYGFAIDKKQTLSRFFTWHDQDLQSTLEIVLEPTASVVGKIEYPPGKNASQITITPKYALANNEAVTSPPASKNTTLTPDGRFKITDLPVGGNLLLEIELNKSKTRIEIGNPAPGETIDIGTIPFQPTPNPNETPPPPINN